MKRFLLVLPLIALVAAGIWVAGRAPTDFVLEEECALYQEYLREQDFRLQREIATKEAALREGAKPDEKLGQLRASLTALHRAHKSITLRGWEVLLIPQGAERPDPADYLVAGKFAVATAQDPPQLQRPIEVWIAPRGALARLLHTLGISP